MKKLLIAFVATAGLLSGCDKDDTTVADKEFVNLSAAELATEPDGSQTLAAGPDGGQYRITVSSSGDWRVAGDCDWARLSATSGHDGDVVTLTVDANDSKEVLKQTFKVFTGAAIARVDVKSDPVYGFEMLTDKVVEVAAGGGRAAFRLYTNLPDVPFRIADDGGEWLSLLEHVQPKGAGNHTFVFEAAENTTFRDRTAKIVLFEGTDNETELSVDQVRNIDIIVTPEKLEVPEAGGDIVVEVKSNMEFTVQMDALSKSFVTQADVKVEGDDLFKTSTYTFHVAANNMMTRSAAINFVSADNTLRRTATVSQTGTKTVPVTIPDANFREELVQQGWITVVDGASCEMTWTGLSVTEMKIWYRDIESLEGIEAFVNLKSLTVNDNRLKTIDVSKNTELETLSCDANPIEVLILGDVNVKSLELNNLYCYDDFWEIVPSASIVISGTKIESLDMRCYVSFYDGLESIDVSECPALKELNCDRGSETLKTLYLKQGQTIPNLTKGESTAIVYK